VISIPGDSVTFLTLFVKHWFAWIELSS